MWSLEIQFKDNGVPIRELLDFSQARCLSRHLGPLEAIYMVNPELTRKRPYSGFPEQMQDSRRGRV